MSYKKKSLIYFFGLLVSTALYYQVIGGFETEDHKEETNLAQFHNEDLEVPETVILHTQKR